MKIKFLNIITILSLSLNADIIISADNLPNVSKEFLQHNFKAPIGIVQKDKNSYEVYLSDGTELEFDIDGAWKEIENKAFPFDLDFLPQNLANIIKNEFQIQKLEKLKEKSTIIRLNLITI